MTGSPAPGTGDDRPAADPRRPGDVSVDGRAPVVWPHQVGVVPLVAAGRLHRPVDDALAAAVSAGGGAAVVGQVLSGLGGVGKTQLAAGLAHRLCSQRRVELLIWVTATSRTAVLARYAQAAADLTGVEDPGPEQGAERLLAWLAVTGRRWLIVLDDLADPADLRGLWPPVTGTGRTVVTTRRRDAALLAGRALIDVDLFSTEEAVAYLHGKLGDRPDRAEEAAELADDLGRLPLALAQAATYILDQELTCAGYRRQLALLRLGKLLPDVLPDDQRTAVADTWALSVARADEATGGTAGLLLRLAALLDPNGIPAALFGTAAVTAFCARRLRRSVTAEDTRAALHVLRRLGLVSFSADVGSAPGGAAFDAGTVRVHALLQRVVCESAPAGDEHRMAVTAANAILELWPEHEPDVTTAQSLRANTVLLHRHAEAHLWHAGGVAHPVLFRAGTSLGNTGLVIAARDYYRQLHVTAIRHLGPDHPQTFTARNNLAHWQGQAGDSPGAALAFKELADDQLRVFGPDHPDTLITRGNLAFWRGEAGDPAGAAAAFQALLTDLLRVFGPNHPDTLITRGSLASWRGEAGDPAGAAAAFQALLTDLLRVLGPDHPDTLITRGNLAHWRGQAGDPAGAATALDGLLTELLRVLGPEHPDTLVTRANLASWRGEAGDPAGAAAAVGELLGDLLRVLGPDHPDTLITRGNLAHWRGRAGDPAGAAAQFEALLADLVRVRGPHHPQTLAVNRKLAHWQARAATAGTAGRR